MPNPEPKTAKSYPVGYCKPPNDTRFSPGQSGNPAGRPRRSPRDRDFSADLGPTLAAAVKVMEGKMRIESSGRMKVVRGLEGIMHLLLEHALCGDVRSSRILLKLMSDAEGIIQRTKAANAGSSEWIFRLAAVLRKAKSLGIDIWDDETAPADLSPKRNFDDQEGAREDHPPKEDPSQRIDPAFDLVRFDPKREQAPDQEGVNRPIVNVDKSPEPAAAPAPKSLEGARVSPSLATTTHDQDTQRGTSAPPNTARRAAPMRPRHWSDPLVKDSRPFSTHGWGTKVRP